VFVIAKNWSKNFAQNMDVNIDPRSGESVDSIRASIASVDQWTAYRIGRTATRYGHFDIGQSGVLFMK
jgi:hypothetical protein